MLTINMISDNIIHQLYQDGRPVIAATTLAINMISDNIIHQLYQDGGPVIAASKAATTLACICN
jgi:hypothetical protein